MKINEVTKKIEPSKPRNFVAKNATTGGAGQHKDKAKTIPRKEKHKGKSLDMSEQGVAVGSLNEFAPGNGGGESGRWYTDDDMINIVGDGWWQDLDISGDVSKQEMINEAQGWLLDQGYRVQVLNVKVNDDDCEWYIEGSFQNNRFAKKGVAEGTHTFDPMKGIHALFALERLYKSGNIGTYAELMKKLGDHTQWTNVVGHNLKQAIPGFTVNDFWTLDNIVRDLSDGYGLPEWFRIINDGGWEDLIEKYKQYMSQRHGQTMNEQGVAEAGEPMKVKSISGNDVTLDQNGQEIKTTTDALAPGQQPNTFSMKPTDPSKIQPGAQVTSSSGSMSEEDEEEVLPVAPDSTESGIHAETDPDLMGSGINHDVGGDATDRFIDQVKDKGFERAQRGGREGLAGRSKRMAEDAELNKMLTIAGLR